MPVSLLKALCIIISRIYTSPKNAHTLNRCRQSFY
uniref:Uncharacterized protein n=1 Tax=Arundo donax TaxID=35708 RepID=A0A0A8Y4V1_ARUDO